MSRYRKIEVRTWSDEKFRALSAIPPSGQGLWFFLLTGPHTTAIPGLFRAGRAAMAEELDWELEAFDEAFREVSQKGMAKADFKAKLVWLPKAILHNKPESPNVVRGWRVELDLLPECDLKREAIQAIQEALSEIGSSYAEAFNELFSPKEKSTAKASPKPLPKASAKASPNQEQEQEQEKKEEPNGSVGGTDLNPDPKTGKDAPPDLPAKPGLPNCNAQAVVDQYHAVLPELPKVRLMNEVRRKAIRKLWQWVLTSKKTDHTPRAETAEQALEWIRGYFTRARDNDFLMGRGIRSGEHANWQCDLDFLLTDKGMKHVIEKTRTAA